MRVRQRRVTLGDVAAAAGVSTGTASHALNGDPVIREETRTRVLEAAQRLNYVPDRNAMRLLHGRSECIGVAYAGRAPTTAGAMFYALVVRGITEALEEHGYTMRLIRLEETALTVPQQGRARPLHALDVDGLMALNWLDSVLMERLCSVGVPLVVVDASGAYPDLLSVDNDDRGGAASGVEYLIGLGHRRIALLNLTLAHPFGREVLAGYLQAFERHGLTVDPWLLRMGDGNIAAGRLAVAELLADPRRPTAVFAAMDEIALGAMQTISEAGLSIPSNISVVSMGDIPLVAEMRPALTTVRIDMEALGRRAAGMLLQAIEGKDPDPSRLVLPTQLVVRDSAAPPPAPSGAA